MLWKETSFINSLQADILHLDGVSPSIARMIFRVRPRIVCSVHDPKPHTGEENSRTTLWRKLTFPYISCYITHSSYSKNLLGRAHGIDQNKISEIPLGTYSIYRLWDPGDIKEEDRNILFFGRLSPYKGIEVLLEAMKLVSMKLSDVRLVIAGQAMPRYTTPQIPQLANNCRIDIIDRYFTNQELCCLFRRACVCILPYTDASQSGVVLTSLAFNTPVVASKTGGLPEYVIDGQTGLLVRPKDAASLAHALISLLSNNRLRNEMVENIANGRTGIPSWDQIAESLARVYRRTWSGRCENTNHKIKYG